MRVVGTMLVASSSLITAALLPSLVAAQTAPPAPGICAGLANTIDGQLMEIAATDAEGIGDDSAARAGVRASTESGLYGAIQANVTLMEAHHCAPYQHPIAMEAFAGAAI